MPIIEGSICYDVCHELGTPVTNRAGCEDLQVLGRSALISSGESPENPQVVACGVPSTHARTYSWSVDFHEEPTVVDPD